MLLALLLPDPADANCPPGFSTEARAALRALPNMGAARDSDNLRLRAALLRFLGDCADWRHADDPVYLTAMRALVRAAHGDDTPLVADPFAGGGSIPLEALRLGCDAYAYAMVAMGTLDMVVETRLKSWDIESAVPLIAGAGGVITDWTGATLGRDGGQVAIAGDRACLEQALPALRPAAK